MGWCMTEKRIGTGKPGPGRKKLAIPNERITVRMNKDQFAEFKRLGGSKWLSGVLDKLKQSREAQGE